MVGEVANGYFLVARGLLTPSELKSALDEQNRTNKSLGRILLDRKLVDDDALMAALADEIGMDLPEALALRRTA